MNEADDTTKILAPNEVRTWSVVAQVAFLLHFIVPYAALVLLAVLYVHLGSRSALLKENTRRALNFNLTLCAVNTLLFLPLLGLPFVSVARIGDYLPFAAFTIVGWALTVTATVGLDIYAVIVSVMNAVAVSNGRVPKYALAYPFVQPVVEMPTNAEASGSPSAEGPVLG